MQPARELQDLLAKAYPCPAFAGVCGTMRWDPPEGHIPRGFLGATGTLAEVEVVLVFAEPGDPQPGDHATLEEALTHASRSFRSGQGVFHQKARAFFDLCWPGLTLEAQMRRVWVTESVLCSATKSTGPVPRAIEDACGERYLKQQLALFPDALVVALGAKAQSRLAHLGIEGFEAAHAFGLPGCYQRAALPSWIRIAELVRGRASGQPTLPAHPRTLKVVPPPIQPPSPVLAVHQSVGSNSGPQTMPASYGGDALRGAMKTDGVNAIVATQLERGVRMCDLVQRLENAGKSPKAARSHLLFLHKNGVKLLVNGEAYQKGQVITSDAFLSLPD